MKTTMSVVVLSVCTALAQQSTGPVPATVPPEGPNWVYISVSAVVLVGVLAVIGYLMKRKKASGPVQPLK